MTHAVTRLILQCTHKWPLTSRTRLYVPLLALAILAGCASTGGTTTSGGGSSASPTATSAPTATATTNANATTVKIIGASGNYSFQPASVTIKVGSTVMWVNNSSVPHTSTSDSGSAVTWDSSAISTGGGSYSFTFSKPGTYAYHCSFHPFMHGVIVVTG